MKRCDPPGLGRYLMAAGLLAVFCSAAFADKPAFRRSYKQVVPGEKFVFVMISPEPFEDEERHTGKAYAEEFRSVRRAYSRSGLYRNDGSTDPVWTVDWYDHRGAVELTPDGVHMVRNHPSFYVIPGGRTGDLGPVLDADAVEFYENGRLIRAHRLRDLVDDTSQFHWTVSQFGWQETARLDADRSEFSLTTADGNHFVFDTRTGEIFTEDRPGRRRHRLLGWAVGSVAVASVAFGGWWLVRRRRR